MPVPLSVKFLGQFSNQELDEIVKLLLLEGWPACKFGKRRSYDFGGRYVVATKARRSEWQTLDDRIGWVNFETAPVLNAAIAKKSANLDTYKLLSSDVRLLLVADCILNSGKLAAVENSLEVNKQGFQTVYFLRYPDAVSVF